MNPITFADDPHLDRDGERIIHPVVCDCCNGSGTVERCKRHPFSAGCACTALALPCEECQDGIINLDDCSCSLCEQVFEDLEKKRAAQKLLAAAPALLSVAIDACDLLEDYYDGDEDDSRTAGVLRDLKRVIEKAGG